MIIQIIAISFGIWFLGKPSMLMLDKLLQISNSIKIAKMMEKKRIKTLTTWITIRKNQSRRNDEL